MCRVALPRGTSLKRTRYRAEETGRDRIAIAPSNEVPPAHLPASTVNPTPVRA